MMLQSALNSIWSEVLDTMNMKQVGTYSRSRHVYVEKDFYSNRESNPGNPQTILLIFLSSSLSESKDNALKHISTFLF